MVYLGSDHRGFKLKEELKVWLMENKIAGEDLGAYRFDSGDDYTLFAEKVASVISASSKKNLEDRGILLCGSGVGAEVVANKFDGVRASIGKSKEQVRAGRNDDDMNVLVIAADFTDEAEAKEMLKVFLETRFGGKARYKRRLSEIKKIEANN